MRTDIDNEKIFVLGRSLGGAVTIYGVSHTENKVYLLKVHNEIGCWCYS